MGVVQTVILHYLDENYIEKVTYEVFVKDFEGRFEFCVDIYRDVDHKASPSSGVAREFKGKDKVLCHPISLIDKGTWADCTSYWVYDKQYDEGYGYSYSLKGQYKAMRDGSNYLGVSLYKINVAGKTDVYVKPMQDNVILPFVLRHRH